MESYKEMLRAVKNNGHWENNRTGVRRLSIHGYMFEHNLNDGFPLLTTKKMSLKNIAVELEFFIKGLQDKKWLQDRGCHIWNEWSNPETVAIKFKEVLDSNLNKEFTSEEKLKTFLNTEKKRIQREEMDLGPIYGVQWRKWRHREWNQNFGIHYEYIDQLENVIETIKRDPTNTQQVVSAWNPTDIPEMALPPCHYAFQLLSDGENLDLLWNQRSCDIFLGIPYNIASYALLLLLIAREVNLKPNKLVGFFADLHIYENHMQQVEEQLSRVPKTLPQVIIDLDPFTIFNWEYNNYRLDGYYPYPALKAPVAI